jgi:hypothetical protein
MEPLKGRDDQALTQQEPPMPERGEEGLDLHSRDRSDDTDLVIDEPELDQRQDQAQTPDLSDDLTEERDRAAEPLADRINREFDREAQSVEDFLNEKSSPSQDELAPQEERDAARTSQDRQSFGRNNLESLVSRGYGQQYVADKEWYQQRQEALRAEQQPTRDPRDTDRDFNRGGRGDL